MVPELELIEPRLLSPSNIDRAPHMTSLVMTFSTFFYVVPTLPNNSYVGALLVRFDVSHNSRFISIVRVQNQINSPSQSSI